MAASSFDRRGAETWKSAVGRRGSQADVVDELMRQCVDSGWEHDSASGAVIKFRSGNVSRLISGLPVGLLEHQVMLFESS